MKEVNRSCFGSGLGPGGRYDIIQPLRVVVVAIVILATVVALEEMICDWYIATVKMEDKKNNRFLIGDCRF